MKRKLDEDDYWALEGPHEGQVAKFYRTATEAVDNDENVPDSDHARHMRCHYTYACAKLKFSSVGEYEDHYVAMHQNVCSVCRRILPTYHLLDLHLEEVHDSFFAVLAERKDMYQCFVVGCEEKFRTPQLRQRHLLDSHHFPKKFNFNIILGKSARSKLIQHHPHPLKNSHTATSRSSTEDPPSTATAMSSIDTGTLQPEASDSTPLPPASKTRKGSKPRKKKQALSGNISGDSFISASSMDSLFSSMASSSGRKSPHVELSDPALNAFTMPPPVASTDQSPNEISPTLVSPTNQKRNRSGVLRKPKLEPSPSRGAASVDTIVASIRKLKFPKRVTFGGVRHGPAEGNGKKAWSLNEVKASHKAAHPATSSDSTLSDRSKSMDLDSFESTRTASPGHI